MFLIRLLLGRPLANKEHTERKIGALEGVPAIGLDGLGSASYGPEAALTALVGLGAASLIYTVPVMAAIIVLLAILYVSYRQTIRAYPTSGGAYTVAKENLGRNASLLAAAALMIDYVLNVAVGISAGVGALISAVPELHPYILHLCLSILAVLTLVNLRGTLEAGRLFAIPTYTFVAAFGVILIVGICKAALSGGSPQPVVAPAPLPPVIEGVSLWILLHAFSSGCTAMTGVEAVSNAVSAFKEPAVKHALRTLTVIVLILGSLLAGIGYLASAYGVGAMDQTQSGYQSVLSQLAAAIVGRNWFYYVAIGSVLAVLALSADTSFTGFPRLCRAIAQDGFLPRPFAVVGRRLVFSVGILYLSAAAALLLMAFGGITERLIPLFAIGAFATFTLSQAGMVVHWRRELKAHPGLAHARRRLLINGLGASATAVALIIIIVAKFSEGAWITLLVVPLTIGLLQSIRRYYDVADRQLRGDEPLDVSRITAPVVLVATEDWSRLTDKALSFALTISPDVYAVHLKSVQGPLTDHPAENDLRERWAAAVETPARAAGLRPPRLIMLESSYRRFEEPLLALVQQLQREEPDRVVAVLLPAVVKPHWWAYLLHTNRGRRMRKALLQCAGSRLVIMTIPWALGGSETTIEVEQELQPEVEGAERVATAIAARLRHRRT